MRNTLLLRKIELFSFRDHKTAYNFLVNIGKNFLQVVNDFDIEEEEVAIENREEFLQKIEKRVRYCISFILFHRGLNDL